MNQSKTGTRLGPRLHDRPRPRPTDRVHGGNRQPDLPQRDHTSSRRRTFDGVAGAPQPRSFVLADGRLDLPGLLERFTEFWHRTEDVLEADEPYRKVTPHVTLLGYLDRAMNGSGFVDREYGVGRGAMDLLIRWSHTGPDGRSTVQREALEVKTHRPGHADPTQAGIRQLDSCLLRLVLTTGHLVIFDQRPAVASRIG